MKPKVVVLFTVLSYTLIGCTSSPQYYRPIGLPGEVACGLLAKINDYISQEFQYFINIDVEDGFQMDDCNGGDMANVFPRAYMNSGAYDRLKHGQGYIVVFVKSVLNDVTVFEVNIAYGGSAVEIYEITLFQSREGNWRLSDAKIIGSID